MKYLITRDNPFYNVVRYAETLEKAVQEKNNLLEEASEGEYLVKVVIAQIMEVAEITMPY